jgi:D-sedoheptulose 7-phosphate isomerase
MLVRYGQAIETELDAFLRCELREHLDIFEATSRVLAEPFKESLNLLETAIRSGGKLMLFGNGGSAADAQHIAAELIIRYKSDRPAIAAISLGTDTSALTACANDLGYEALFERQLAGLGRMHDAAIGISTSGKSPNVLRGIRQAKAMGLTTLGLTGGSGGEMPGICDVCVVVPSTVTARIQEMHIMIGHFWCKALEQRLGFV